MNLTSYPKYKSSGVEWLGDVPEHWACAPLKTFSTMNDEVLAETTFADFEIDYIEISDVQFGRGIVASTLINFG